jgi:hydroxymethylglutaryl-CoA lyase
MAWSSTSAVIEYPKNPMNIPSRVQLIDVGPRDGLQNEKQPVPAEVKIELVHRLQTAGLTEI